MLNQFSSVQDAIVNAITKGVNIKISLSNGETREIEPRVIGTTTKDNLVVAGVKHDGLMYRQYKLENISQVEINDTPSDLGKDYKVLESSWNSIIASR